MKSKILTLTGMWELHRVLKKGIGNEQYLVDEVFNILDNISKEDFLQSLLLLYPTIELTKLNPVEMATLFIAGLKRNNFFAFAEVIQGLEHGNSKQ